MSPNPQHGTPAGDVTIALRKLARQSGGDVQELMTLVRARRAAGAHCDLSVPR